MRISDPRSPRLSDNVRAIHPLESDGQSAIAGNGDSGGPLLNKSSDILGTVEGGAVVDGQGINLYLMTTGTLAHELFAHPEPREHPTRQWTEVRDLQNLLPRTQDSICSPRKFTTPNLRER